MILSEMGLVQFVNEVDSKSPAPGGGSVSALAGALGAALFRMVGHLSIGKKKYEALDDQAKGQFTSVFIRMEALKTDLLTLIDKDTEAFNHVMDAFRMPKETEVEKVVRDANIQVATIEAIEIPFQVAQKAYSALEEASPVIKYGNPNTLSDVGVAVMMFGSAIEGAVLNIRINLSGLKDRDLALKFQKESEDILDKAMTIKRVILESIHESLKLK